MANCIGAGNIKPFYRFTQLGTLFSQMVVGLSVLALLDLWVATTGVMFPWRHGHSQGWWKTRSCVTLILAGAGWFFGRYFRNDIIEGIWKNQSIIEWGQGGLYGVKVCFKVLRQFAREDIEKLWLGRTFKERLVPWLPRRTHNFLELVYTIVELGEEIDPIEIEFAKGNEFFCEKFYLKR